MCGILGTYKLPNLDIQKQLTYIKHRGPDATGTATADQTHHGHVRLALLDLTPASNQPYRYRDTILTYNGELWNHQQLRNELQTLGHNFKTTGDTEVLAAALHQWGTNALPKLDGMFTFAWSHNDTHILARDRFGEIPLYIHRNGASFAWSSERKGLPKNYQASPLPPGTYLNLTTGKLHTWYTIPQTNNDPRGILQLLEQGVTNRLIADAPLCVLISGGLDSSLILTLAKKHKPDVVAYTATVNPNSPDLKAARRLCQELQIPLTEIQVPQPTPNQLEAAAKTIEIPSKAQVEIAALCIPLAHAIRSDGYRALLSGESADELFGGYGNMMIKGAKANDNAWRDIRIHAVKRMARGNFIRTNTSFMAAGIEARLPFIELPLVEKALNLTKTQSPPGKKALKAASAEILPNWVIRRPKETFQGGAGMREAAAATVNDPKGYYRSIISTTYGKSALQ
jgi:asparagine synthase (glutamine-hydrolysing)